MKELSIEEKAKRYDKAINAIKELKEKHPTAHVIKDWINENFPELSESEDERIRKELLQIAKESEDSFYMVMTPNKREKVIAWLERQGKLMKALQISNARIGELIEKNYYLKEQLEKQGNNMGISEATKQKLEDNLNEALEKETPESWNEFLDDKVEPKFEIGDLITNGILVGEIDEIHELGYHAYFGDHYADVPDIENWHKWTIQDAKNGDVLSYRNGQWIFILKRIIDKDSFEYYTLWSTIHNDLTINDSAFSLLINSIYPATKEQRDTLLKAMTDAGYKWDAEKKLLKKIEEKPADKSDLVLNILNKENREVQQEDLIKKPSLIPIGENETVLSDVISILDNGFMPSSMERARLVKGLQSLKDRVQPKQEWSKEDNKMIDSIAVHLNATTSGFPEERAWADRFMNWLKSLKDRVQLLPKQEWSKEDERLFQIVIDVLDRQNHLGNISRTDLIACVRKLKSLRPQNKWKESLATADLEKSLCDIQNGFSDTSLEYRTLGEAIEFIRCTESKPQWKPSDEQMDALYTYIYNPQYFSSPDPRMELVESVYKDLKKLKEK